MTLIAALAMVALFAASYQIFRSWFAPAVIYTMSWTIALFTIAALEPLLYGISGDAAVCYIVAAALFMLGSLFGQRMRRPSAPAALPEVWSGDRAQLVVDVLLLVVLVTTPFLVQQLMSAQGLGGIIETLRVSRSDSVEANGEIGTFGLLKNLPVLAQFVVMMSVYIYDGRLRSKVRIAVGCVLWLFVALPSGSKLIALQLPFMVAACFAISMRRIPWKIAAASGAGFAVVFLSGLYFINYGYQVTKGESVPLAKLMADMASYAYGGVVGFSHLITSQVSFDPTQSPLRTPMYIVDAVAAPFGFDPPFVLRSEHAPFMDVGQGLSGNVYTVLYAYYGAGGVVGLFAWSLIAGFFGGWVYRSIAMGRRWSYFVYPWVAYACVMSVQSEQLFGASLAIMKACLLMTLFSVLLAKREHASLRHGSSHV